MIIIILKDKASVLFLNREKIVEDNVEDESVFYFDRIDMLGDGFLKLFFGQIVCATIGDGYDFFYFIKSDHNIFYKNINKLDMKKSQKFYKWLSIYHCICFAHNDVKLLKDLSSSLEKVFLWSNQDKKTFKHLLGLHSKNEAIFSIKLVQKMVKEVLGEEIKSNLQFAFIANMLYNSHNIFVNALVDANLSFAS